MPHRKKQNLIQLNLNYRCGKIKKYGQRTKIL